ncbi:hypothetical protein ES288_D11G143000v1 [Gossypium darwinii]|uniref:Bifunctional inhibitor/plant lipid transfer protein/seed storage helical domain-containing protein n=1 Tax=Gossypium darwinii TaxID=34276 RepID=A0A5D2AJM8_GOSDA|nr:hypothetical protein GOBAR_DD22010 [Gossypium barbadense]TYG45034.1 hypothetical protein ES288_D11G143000v1 [Gossypium darwinii]
MKGSAMVAMLFIIATNLWTGSMAQSSCTNVLISMSPCLDYIQGNSSKPSSSCCSQLANVVRSNPQCLCQVLNGGASSLGVSVNQTQAMALPTACNVKTPPASQCNASSPSGSPSGTSNSPSSGGGGSKSNVPTTDDSTSAGNSTKLSFSVVCLFFLLFIASEHVSPFVDPLSSISTFNFFFSMCY